MKRAIRTVIFVVAFVVLGGLTVALWHFHYDVKPGMMKSIIATVMKQPPASVSFFNDREYNLI